MHASVIVANPVGQSFSHAMAQAAVDVLRAAGNTIAFHDLYAEGFDPVQRTGESGNTQSSDALVERHCEEIARADLILIFHPNWWGQPPAILKGWIDRVMRLGTAYGYPPGVTAEGVPVGLLKARRALVFNTCNTPPERERQVFGDPLEAIWRHCVFGLCGVPDVVRRMVGPIAGSSLEEREGWLGEVAELVREASRRDLHGLATTSTEEPSR